MQNSEKPAKFIAPQTWQMELLLNNPLFEALTTRFDFSCYKTFPNAQELTALLHQHTELKQWCFVDQSVLTQDGRYYEDFIFETQKIPMRENNWHDFFGALIWCLFPKTKQRLNEIHREEIALHGHKERSKIRHKLTLLDECGVLLCVTASEQPIVNLLRGHHWQEAFFEKKNLWPHLRPVIFGHANYEMATHPFIGLTAKLWVLEISEQERSLLDTEGYTFLDTLLAWQLEDSKRVLDNQQLSPLPLLGVPGWFAGQTQEFYQNTDYFRPKRQGHSN